MNADEKKKLIKEIRTVSAAFESMVPWVELGDEVELKRRVGLSMGAGSILHRLVHELCMHPIAIRDRALMNSLKRTGP
jgi:hypothetical protein